MGNKYNITKTLLSLASVVMALAIHSTLARGEDLEAKFKKLEAKYNDLESNLVDLQLVSVMNQIHLSGTFINRYEDFETTYGVPGTAKQKEHIRAFSTYFGLNIDKKINSKISVYSTIAMSKFWNNEGRNETYGAYTASEAGSYSMAGSTPKIDRAYMAYFFDLPLVFAIGRMSTNSGPPINELDGLERLGTYPRFAYNSIFDGIALVYNFSSLLPAKNAFTMRAFYTPYVNISDTNRTKQLQDNSIRIPSDTYQGGILSEYENSNVTWLGKLNLTHMWYSYNAFYLDGTNGHPSATNTSPKNPFSNGGANMGFIEFEDIAHKGLNISLSGLFYWNQQSGSTDPGVAIDPHKYRSSAYLYNVNQKIGSSLIVGGEYITTDENFYLDEWSTLNIIPFYFTPNSKGYHFFITEKILNPITLRMGFYSLKSKPCGLSSANSGLYNDESKSTSIYANIRLDF